MGSASNAMGQDQSDDKISLFLEDWELGRVALPQTWTCCARKCMKPGGWVAATKRPAVAARNVFSHRERAVTKGEGCGERKTKKKKECLKDSESEWFLRLVSFLLS